MASDHAAEEQTWRREEAPDSATVARHAPLVDWRPAQSLLVRFVCLYFALYSLATLQIIPYTNELLAPLVSWVGRQLFNVAAVPQRSGSGDTIFHYVQVLTLILAAVVGALGWSLLDRRAETDQKFYARLRVLLRYTLVLTMISYGSAKVIKTQFPEPSLFRLVQPYGDSSPMGLLWTFMGFSEPYTVFTGLAELAGGLLLLSRRTTLLGALICAAAMSHVLMLNLSYDVPVKLYSAHLLAMALILVAPDLPRLIDFFVLGRPSAPTVFPPLFKQGSGIHTFGQPLAVLLVLGFALIVLAGAWSARASFGDGAPKPPLYGVWEVERFTFDGNERPALLGDPRRWRRLIIDRGERGSIQMMNDQLEHYRLSVNSEAQRISLIDPGSAKELTLVYEQPSPTRLRATGSYNGRPIEVTLRQRSFLLQTRGFNWVNETPFNR